MARRFRRLCRGDELDPNPAPSHRVRRHLSHKPVTSSGERLLRRDRQEGAKLDTRTDAGSGSIRPGTSAVSEGVVGTRSSTAGGTIYRQRGNSWHIRFQGSLGNRGKEALRCGPAGEIGATARGGPSMANHESDSYKGLAAVLVLAESGVLAYAQPFHPEIPRVWDDQEMARF